MMMPLRREEAGRNVDAELLRQPLHGEHRRMLIHRKGAGEMALVLGAAEIMALKQLGREDDLRALVGGFAHECGYRVDIVVDAVGEGKLERSDEHTSELQSLMRISYAVFCLQKKKQLIRS